MQPYEKPSSKISRKRIFFDNFLGGVAWGIGSAIGAAILVAILGFFLAKVNIVPLVASFVSQVNQVVEQKESTKNAPTPTGY